MRFIKSLLLVAAITASMAHAQTDTTFTYQGNLLNNGSPANGFYTISFKLFDALVGGSTVGGTVTIDPQEVTNGLFMAELDFLALDFAGTSYWLEITVDGNILAPRVALTASPFSIQTRGIFAKNDLSFVGVGRKVNITPNEFFGVHAPVSSGFGGMYISTDGQNGTPFYGYSAGGDVDAYHYYHGLSGRWILNNNGDHLVVTSSGQVGIGTLTPSNILTVESDQSQTAAANIRNTNTTDVAFGLIASVESSGNGTMAIRGTASADSGLVYGVGGISRSTSGVGVIGEASSFSGATVGVSGVSSSRIGTGVSGEVFSFTGVNYGVYGKTSSPSGYDFYAAGAGINYGSSSSIRWKSNVVNIDHPLDKLAQLRGVYYDWDEEHGGQHAIGMIAEEVGKVIPEIVGYEDNGIDAVGLDYSMLTPLLVEAVNALRDEKDAENAELRKQNAQLQARLTHIESLLVQLATE